MAKKKKKKEEKKKKKKILGRRAKNTIIVIILFTISLLNIAAFFNKAGVLGEYFLKGSDWLLGGGRFFVPLFFIAAALSILARIKKPLWLTLFGTVLLTVSSVSFLNIISGEGSGGFIGKTIGGFTIKYLDKIGAFIILGAFSLISLVLVFNLSLGFLFKKKEDDEDKKDKKDKKEVSKEKTQGSLDFEEEKPSLFKRLSQKETKILHRPIFKLKKLEEEGSSKKTSRKKSKQEETEEKAKLGEADLEGYEFPSLELLIQESSDKEGVKKSEINNNIEIIQETLKNFGIDVTMGEVSVGPTVTQYTLKPAQGVKLSQIVARQNDLALALAAHPLRVEAPIPGKSLVGIEVPNKKTHKVKLRDLLETSNYEDKKKPLTMPLGRDVAGEPFYDDLARMPHLLIAGATGTGKSVAIHNILTSFLYQNSPRSLRLILVDPKRVELTLYNDIPHLLTPVITDAQKAINSLKWAISEMERRYELLSQMGARDITSYNKEIEKKQKKSSDNNDDHKFLPYIVIVIDELADIMLNYGRETEAAVVRLAQMARAVGIHLILSTQRPSVEVITGLIKANITFRIAFQVASQVDSRTIIDSAGAEKLLGNGDMLYQTGDSSKPYRIQGALLAEREAKKVVKFLRKQDYDEEDVDLGDKSKGEESKIADLEQHEFDDELYPEAKKIVLKANKGSASLLQRRLRIGYARSARLLDMLEEDGIIGPPRGSKARKVIIDQPDNEI